MENWMGLLRIHVHRGKNLAIRDLRSSDPYAVVQMGEQVLKTCVVKKNVNPLWNEDLTLKIAEPILPIKISVYDKDTFSRDDEMGDAEFDIKLFIETVLKSKTRLDHVPSDTTLARVKPGKENCLAKESCIVWTNGKVVQHMILRLQNVECGEVELQLQWIDIHSSSGLST